MAISPEDIPIEPDQNLPELSLIKGSPEPLFNTKSESYLASIARDPHLSKAQRSSLIASGLLDNISAALLQERGEWPSAEELAESYELASYLCDTKNSDETDIVVEIFDEALRSEDIPPQYAQILEMSQRSAGRLTLGTSGEVAAMMIRLWLVIEADIEIPTLFNKIKAQAMARIALKNHRSGFRF